MLWITSTSADAVGCQVEVEVVAQLARRQGGWDLRNLVVNSCYNNDIWNDWAGWDVWNDWAGWDRMKQLKWFELLWSLWRMMVAGTVMIIVHIVRRKHNHYETMSATNSSTCTVESQKRGSHEQNSMTKVSVKIEHTHSPGWAYLMCLKNSYP